MKKNQHIKLFKQKYNKSLEYEAINYYKKHQLIKLFNSNTNYKWMGLRDCIYKWPIIKYNSIENTNKIMTTPWKPQH